MEIQQHEKTIGSRSLDVIQQLLGLEHGAGGLIAGVKSLQSFRHRPPIRLELQPLADLPDDGDDLRLLVALHRDEWRPRADDRFQIAQWAFRVERSGLGESRERKIHLFMSHNTRNRGRFQEKNPARFRCACQRAAFWAMPYMAK